MSNEDRIEKIQGLLAKAESTEFPEEAASLTQKAAELMEKWMIEEAQLQSHSKSKSEKFITENVELPPGPAALAYCELVWAVKDHTQTQATVAKRFKNGGFHHYVGTFYGFESDVIRALMLTNSLIVQVQRDWHSEDLRLEKALTYDLNVFNHSFVEGYAFKVRSRFQEMRKDTLEEPKNAGVGIILRSKVQKAEDFMHENLGYEPKPNKDKRQSDYIGRTVGGVFGGKADIGQVAVGNAKTPIGGE